VRALVRLLARSPIAGTLILLTLLAACGEKPPAQPGTAERADEVRAKAARWLWAHQAPDGGWHSTQYGLLRAGQSLTPFVLDALLTVPEDVVPRHQGLVHRALAFIVSRVDENGMLGVTADPVVDYPSYATALALGLIRREIDRTALADRMRNALLARQYKETLGWERAHPAFGAWGMGAERPRPPEAGHLDLSMTRHVLEALENERGPGVEAARKRARIFLERCRGRDGGYFFTTVMADKNKAGTRADGTYLSYGTATADGILAAWTVARHESDLGLKRAYDWLLRHHRPDVVPGFPDEHAAGWPTSMIFYYRAASARALAMGGHDEAPAGHDWRREMIAALERDQAADGSFRSAGNLMKEDDPLIATALALQALAAIREHTSDADGG